MASHTYSATYTYSIVTISGGLRSEVDADGYDTYEAAEAMALDAHDGEWRLQRVHGDPGGEYCREHGCPRWRCDESHEPEVAS
jgi:hypothetical protein